MRLGHPLALHGVRLFVVAAAAAQSLLHHVLGGAPHYCVELSLKLSCELRLLRMRIERHEDFLVAEARHRHELHIVLLAVARHLNSAWSGVTRISSLTLFESIINLIK